MREQFSLLLGLYRHPIQAASRIIDEGRMWFAIAAAVLVMGGLQTGVVVMGARLLAHSAPVAATATVPVPAPAGYGDIETPAAPRISPLTRAWVRLASPLASLKILAVLALAFVPAVILVITLYRSHESFPVMLRKDYLPLLNCLLLSFSVAYLPLALMGLFWPAPALPLLFAAALCSVYFLCLAACCSRTLWGSSFGVASLATGAGCVAMSAGVVFAMLTGGSFYFLSSPFFLYYVWRFISSDVRSLGDGFRSRQHLRRQLDIATNNPRDSDAHYQLGLIYQQRRQLEEAKARFSRAFEIDPREAEPAFQLGSIALEQGQLEAAVEWLRKAAAIDDKCASNEVWRELGKAYSKSSRFTEALSALNKYVQRRPYDPEGLYWQGKTLAALGNPEEAAQALAACEEAVITMPPHRRRQLGKWRRMASEEARKLERLRAIAS